MFQQKSSPIDKLRNIDFTKVEQYDPSREDGFDFVAFETKLPVLIELDKSSQKEHGNLNTYECLTLRVLKKIDW
jgi:hypothetical protein